MMVSPKVSILTVCCNSKKNLEATMKSIFNQTYSNIEDIFIDGISWSNTLEIIKKFRQKNRLLNIANYIILQK